MRAPRLEEHRGSIPDGLGPLACRYNSKYAYDPIFALGFVSVFDQVTEGMDEGERTAIFEAYVRALGEDPAQYRQDAERLSAAAAKAGGAEGLLPSTSGSDIQREMAALAERINSGRFYYTKWFAVGLFKLLETVGVKARAGRAGAGPC